ncbi:MAG: CD1871A family CXXC motif-containing protein [Clostridium sp.]|uniref:CD1871A family CXXC motif-containing protein n=1 Tax=Clostridium sp. TaxID=1506 RepID=UPI00291463F4|nr:CD1871A family CXXC motif-containing protein [Clostridium sp.]MDU7337882.1 CD1871A family CXXC motif-containing protein [Clostridium sp.]
MERVGKNPRFLRWGIAAGAVVMMAVGLWNGENRTVLAKAVQICLECIGIG